MFMATLDASIVLIALPAIFNGIRLNPLAPGNTSYLLWLLMGYLVVTAVLVVTFGQLGDMFGRVRMYNLGSPSSPCSRIPLSVTWLHGSRRHLHDPDARRAGDRRLAADGQLDRHPHRRLPGEQRGTLSGST